MVVIDYQSDCLTSMLRKKSSKKKRKASSCFDSPSSQGETEMELIDVDKHTPSRKVRKVGWLDLEPIDAPTGAEFDLENINNLWYR